jgi:hypothetical protein
MLFKFISIDGSYYLFDFDSCVGKVRVEKHMKSGSMSSETSCLREVIDNKIVWRPEDDGWVCSGAKKYCNKLLGNKTFW